MRRAIACVAFAVGCMQSACVVTTGDGGTPVAETNPTVPVVNQGNLVVDWTIDGATDPNRCKEAFADVVHVRIFTETDAFVGTYEQRCDAFATTIALSAGRYHAAAELLDGTGHARTTSVDIDPFTIVGDTELRIPIDFPIDSFY